jgi:hypothetical protein
VKKVLSMCLALSALSACGPQTPPLAPPSLSVDPSLAPPLAELPGFDEGETRPIATVTGPADTRASFVENELWLSTADPAELDAFLARWHGEVLLSFDPSEHGMSGLAPQYLVRVDASAADPSLLAEDLRTLDPNATGDHRVSSEAGLDLLAAGAREAANGLQLGINWLGSGAEFSDRSSVEAPSADKTVAGVAYDPNAFTWPSHNATGGSFTSVLEIGVAEAWRALEFAGRLDEEVGIAVLDMGFEPDEDFPAGWQAIPNVPLFNPIGTENLVDCAGGNSCPWHGTNVASAAFALPDNGYGSSGPAGPVAHPILVFTFCDMFTLIVALGEAKAFGADIANMSCGAPVPDYLAWSVLPFEAATALFRTTGMLLFASAGNSGEDVDAERCVLGACLGWERAWHTPCENAGVICVGGIRGNAKTRHPKSNYGDEQVDIFAPYTLWLGPNPAAPGNQARARNGTSYSSPFVAGVAALIWAADPSLGADGVEEILMQTAHDSPDPNVKRYVNALGAVLTALGNVPPRLEVFGVDDGGTVERGLNLPVNLSATANDLEDGNGCCTIEWRSEADGLLGTGTAVQHVFDSVGSRTIVVTAEDEGGATSSVSFTLVIVNAPPTVAITKPVEGAEIFRTAAVVIRASADDLNEPGGELPCAALTWTSSFPSDPFPQTGCELEVSLDDSGTRTITVTGTDPQGASGVDSVTVDVVDPPANLPPFVRITSPENGADIPLSGDLALVGTATDPEGDTPLSFEWSASLDGGEPVAVGSGADLDWSPSGTFDFGELGEGFHSIQLRLSVTDDEDNTGSDFVILTTTIVN